MLMNIVFNGQPRLVRPHTTVADLLVDLKLPSRQVAVEVNLDLIPREKHEVHVLREGDQVEVVTLVGGG